MRALRSMAFLALVPILATVLSGDAARQTRDPRPQNPAGTSTVAGRVITAEGRPLRRARVTLRLIPAAAVNSGGRGGGTVWQAVSDDEGAFAFRNIPAGTYSLSSNHSSYLPAEYGQRFIGQPGRTLQLESGQTLRADLVSVRGGAITGRVTDERGDPVPDVSIEVFRYVVNGGERTVQRVGGRSYPSNDIGQYRVANLPPGEYLLSARANNQMFGPPGMQEEGPGTGYAPTWYPGVATPSTSQTIRVAPGQEAGGMDFVLYPTRLVTVTGTVTSSTGAPLDRVILLVRPGDPALSNTINAETMVNQGAFRVANLAPGEYVFHAQSMPAGGRGATPAEREAAAEYARVRVNVTAPIDGMTIQLRPGVKLTVRTEAPAGSPPARAFVSLVSMDGLGVGPGGGMTQGPDGAVTMTVAPGMYRAQLPPNMDPWAVEGVIVNGRDARQTPFEVTSGAPMSMTVKLGPGATLSGTANAGLQPASDYTVVVMTANAADRMATMNGVRTARPDQKGQFSLKGLPAGEYYVAAVDFVESTRLYDPALWKRLEPVSTRVSVARGEQKTLALPYAPITSAR